VVSHWRFLLKYIIIHIHCDGPRDFTSVIDGTKIISDTIPTTAIYPREQCFG
jgi:hypothetical protein